MHATEMRQRLMTQEKRQFQKIIELCLEVCEEQTYLYYFYEIQPGAVQLLKDEGYDVKQLKSGVFPEWCISW